MSSATQRRRHRHHDGIVAFALLEILQLLGDVIGAKPGQTRPLGIGAIAVCAMASLAHDGFGCAGLRVAGRQCRRLTDECAGNACCEASKTASYRLRPHTSRELPRAANCTLESIICVPTRRSSQIYPHVKFVTSAAEAHQLAPDTGREIAFAGRSNSGKSTAINAITQRAGLARVSRTPGRTQLINFFELAPERRLVDLPGYGFAKVPEKVRARWLS